MITFKFPHIACPGHSMNMTIDIFVTTFRAILTAALFVSLPHSIESNLHLTLTKSSPVKSTAAWPKKML
jgi:hypothetical protein